MKYRTVTERVGEYLGPVDWSYDFRSHFGSMGATDKVRDERCAEAIAQLRKLAEQPERYLATTDGGWPKTGFHRVLTVGMYDGWPYWRPVPSVLLDGPLGGEWHSFYSIEEVCERRDWKPTEQETEG